MGLGQELYLYLLALSSAPLSATAFFLKTDEFLHSEGLEILVSSALYELVGAASGAAERLA